MSIEQSILADLQARTQSEAGLLALVVAGSDSGVAAWYSGQAGEPAIRPTRLTQGQLMDRLGFDVAGAILAKLRAFSTTQAAYAPLVAEAVRALDFRGESPDFGDAVTREVIGGLAVAEVITDAERDALLGQAQYTPSLAEQLFGRALTADDVSLALRPVRVAGTAQLVEGWQAAQGGE